MHSRRLLPLYQTYWLVGFVLLPLASVPIRAADRAPAAAQAAAPAPAAASAAEAEVQQAAQAFDSALEKGDAAALASLFAPDGELVDEEGNIYQGRDAIQAAFADLFARFTQLKVTTEVESLRILGGDMAIIDATRRIGWNGEEPVSIRTQVTRRKLDGRWLIVSVREYFDERPATPHKNLESLAWLVGEWVDESPDAVITLEIAWSHDENYLIAKYQTSVAGQVALTTEQRIAWDPHAETFRSWTFDSDGGFAQGRWTQVEDGWVIQWESVLPDGLTGSSNFKLTKLDDDRLRYVITQRAAGGSPLPDREVTVVRKPKADE